MAVGAAGGLAIAAFAFGAVLGDRGAVPPPNPVSQLSLPRLVGMRLIAGFEGTTVPEPLRRAIHQGDLAGVVLFRENLPSRATARTLIAEVESIRRPPGLRDPLLIMVDQEGGLVKRLPGPPTASAAQIGAAGDVGDHPGGLDVRARGPARHDPVLLAQLRHAREAPRVGRRPAQHPAAPKAEPRRTT